ncbi:MAG: protein-L-isoaspartate(D-aspartate) O-methyltransferase [Bacteroidota bacterium]
MINFRSLITLGFVLLLHTSTVLAQKEGQKDTFLRVRQRMVRNQISARGIKNQQVLKAMLKVPRHRFVPSAYKRMAYDDRPLPIGHGQTISQPYIVALMTEALALTPEMKVLEIGTGSGYQAAILSLLCKEVYSIEILAPLANEARVTLNELGYDNVKVKTGDGYQGWPEYSPFDAIIVTCAPEAIPEKLKDQLAEGGRMIIPVGGNLTQELILIRKKEGRLFQESVAPVRFVPMVQER